jgi:hypothetical protein
MENNVLSLDFAAENTDLSPDFSAEWKQIDEDLKGEAAGALRIGLNLKKIRDALKPRGLWLDALRDHGMSQPQASCYIRFAEMPESDRDRFQRIEGFSLSDAIGERRKRASDNSPANSRNGDDEVAVPDEELPDRLAEVNWQRQAADEIIEAGVEALAEEPYPGYAAGDPRLRSKLREVAAAMDKVIRAGLDAELKKRLLPGAE